MKKYLLNVSMIAFVAIGSINGFGQSFNAVYDFSGVTATSGRTDPTPPPTVTGITFGSFSGTSNLSTNSSGAGRFSLTTWPLGATNGSDVFTGTIDLTKYYEVTLTPQTYYTFTLDSIAFTQQRSGTGIRQYAVRSSADGYAANLPAVIDPLNASLQIVAGNIIQVTDASSTAQNGSKINLPAASFANLNSAITFRFYGWNAEGTGGTFSIDNVKFSGTAFLSPTAPNIVVSSNTLVFPSTGINNTSTALNYTVRGANLTDPVTITTAAPFTISGTASGTYTTTLTLSVAEVATDKTIFVKFAPLAAGTFTGTITQTSTGAATKTITLSGDGINPGNLTFNFDNCAVSGVPGTGFLSYSVRGAQVWTCSNFGRNSTRGVDMNGYSGGAQDNEDWLISPPLDINALALPILKFWSRGEFTGPSLQVLVSTNYDGFSNPGTATWTDLQALLPPLTNTWTLTDGIDLSAYKTSPVYIAFKYTSSEELGAARWTIDDVDVTNRTQLLSANPVLLNFNEVSAGNHSAGIKFSVKAVGYGNITLTAPAGYDLSTDSSNYTSSLILNAVALQAGSFVFARFSPTAKALKVQGLINYTAPGLDSNLVTLTGTSYPKAETFDAGCYNLSFFGSNPNNNPTQAKIDLQVANIAVVINKLKLDVLGVEEVSNDVAMDSLIKRLPNHKGLLSGRWSYSFDPPDPNFPPQKTGFIYDSLTMKLISSRDMFVQLYDQARTTSPGLLPNYPGGSPSSFWASGRLPFMAIFDATIGGITQRVIVIDIHAKSASDAASYNRRVYDVKVLKDSLDAYYPNDNILIVGDFNDRVMGSIYAGSPNSPYQNFVTDIADYDALTLPLDQAGRVSFLSGSGLIDHVMITNELVDEYIAGSADIEDPRSYIPGYNATTASDHMPVYARFNFSTVLPVTLTSLKAQQKGKQVLVTWTTLAEYNSDYFVVERSADSRNFHSLGFVKSRGNANEVTNYQLTDSFPLTGINFYRLKQVDLDGKIKYSMVVSVGLNTGTTNRLVVYPNPVINQFRLNLNSTASNYTGKIIGSDGSMVMQTGGSVLQISQQVNHHLYKLKPGAYILRLNSATEDYSVKFLKQ
ncbi:MAG: choice-of-anchor J domain-containing protein [Ferruginibacter sp.]|nr:choice-of-anchor J domain-containing protein [Ferruginibacter sp.]